MEDRLREVLRELGRELRRELADSSDANQAVRRLHEEGYSLFFLLDRLGRVSTTAEATAGAPVRAAEVVAPKTPPVVRQATEPEFRIDGHDLRFLRSLGIDPTRRIRRRGRGQTS